MVLDASFLMLLVVQAKRSYLMLFLQHIELRVYYALQLPPQVLQLLIFPNIFVGIIESESAILTPKNADCEIINAIDRKSTRLNSSHRH